MIPNVSDPGKGFRGALDYDFKPSKQPELLGGTLRAETARGLAAELGGWRALNEQVTKPVFHCSLSAAPDDDLSPERWRDVAADFVQRMGYGNAPWVAIRHRDTAIDHVHIVASRIDNDGRYVPNHQERRRSQEVCREIERAHGLSQLRAPAKRARPTRNDLAAFERTGQVTVKARLLEHIDLAARDRPTMGRFVERLEAQGVEVRANLATTGHVSGISFAFDGVACRGSDLGRGYTWRQLQDRAGIAYEPARDLPALRSAAARATTFIAARRPLVRDPEAPPVPPFEHPAAAFTQAAVLESRAEIAERHDQFLHAFDAARTAADSTRRQLDRETSLDQAVADHRAALEHALSHIYASPAAAWNHLADRLRRDGLEPAAQILERRPAELGLLLGHAFGRYESQARRDALAATADASRELRAVVAVAGEVHRGGTEALRQTVAAHHRRAEDLLADLQRLPDLGSLRIEILRAGRTLGAATVNVLSARAARVFAATARLLGRTFGQHRDRGLGRGGDGPDLGR